MGPAGYNVVRFIQLGLSNGGITEIVARVPYLLEGGSRTEDVAAMIGNRIASEVATLEYIASHTSIPVPYVITHNNNGGEVGSPYILMTKADGVPLSKVWDDMEDGKREIILRQVVHILLQLSSIRFDGIGALMRKRKGGGKTDDEWYIVPAPTILGSGSNIACTKVVLITG